MGAQQEMLPDLIRRWLRRVQTLPKIMDLREVLEIRGTKWWRAGRRHSFFNGIGAAMGGSAAGYDAHFSADASLEAEGDVGAAMKKSKAQCGSKR